MAKHKGRRRRRGIVAIPFSIQGALGTLGDETVIVVAALGSNFTEDFYLVSVDVSVHIRGLTANEGIPTQYGVAHSDLSVTEIGENLDAEMTSPDDIIAKERSRRPVRSAGYLRGGNLAIEVRQETDKVRIPCRFSIGDGFNLSCWVKNKSGSALTTGAVQEWFGTMFGRWQR